MAPAYVEAKRKAPLSILHLNMESGAFLLTRRSQRDFAEHPAPTRLRPTEEHEHNNIVYTNKKFLILSQIKFIVHQL